MTIREYLAKMKGGSKGPPGVGFVEMLWAWVGSAAGISACGYLSMSYFEPRDLPLLIASLGASSALLYGAARSPLAQPRNLIGGHIISAFVGVGCYKLFAPHVWLAATGAVSFAIVAMLATRTLHPPGGATALTAVIGGKKIHDLGFLYPFVPVGVAVLVLLLVALLVNNLSPRRKYPEYWL